jgi:hypothetical protein
MLRGFGKHFCRLALALVLSAANAPAQTASTGNFSLDDNFRAGWHEAALGTAAMFSPVGPVSNRPRVNYVTAFANAGYMLYDAGGSGFFRGNFELAPEVFGAGIYEATGHYIAGTTLWIRQNFVPRDWRFVPFGQIGAGISSMDIDHKYDGHNFNFNLDSSLGCRYFISPRLSVFGELRYQHLSNANTGSHNIGINALGPSFGVAWHF